MYQHELKTGDTVTCAHTGKGGFITEINGNKIHVNWGGAKSEWTTQAHLEAW